MTFSKKQEADDCTVWDFPMIFNQSKATHFFPQLCTNLCNFSVKLLSFSLTQFKFIVEFKFKLKFIVEFHYIIHFSICTARS